MVMDTIGYDMKCQRHGTRQRQVSGRALALASVPLIFFSFPFFRFDSPCLFFTGYPPKNLLFLFGAASSLALLVLLAFVCFVPGWFLIGFILCLACDRTYRIRIHTGIGIGIGTDHMPCPSGAAQRNQRGPGPTTRYATESARIGPRVHARYMSCQSLDTWVLHCAIANINPQPTHSTQPLGTG